MSTSFLSFALALSAVFFYGTPAISNGGIEFTWGPPHWSMRHLADKYKINGAPLPELNTFRLIHIIKRIKIKKITYVVDF
jgi:hypothetical protein